jgi:phytoene dehydrogenase-like protein
MASHSSVAVIGGGLGGLAAACVTAARGHQVTLYDKNPWLGGKAAVLHEGGFRFDMGPTILTGAARAGAHLRGGRTLRARLHGSAPARPAMALLLRRRHADRPRREHRPHGAEMDRFAPGSGAGEGYKRFQGISDHLHDVSNRFFFWKPVEDLFDTINIRANLNPSTLKDVLSLRMGSSVAGTIRAR